MKYFHLLKVKPLKGTISRVFQHLGEWRVFFQAYLYDHTEWFLRQKNCIIISPVFKTRLLEWMQYLKSLSIVFENTLIYLKKIMLFFKNPLWLSLRFGQWHLPLPSLALGLPTEARLFSSACGMNKLSHSWLHIAEKINRGQCTSLPQLLQIFAFTVYTYSYDISLLGWLPQLLVNYIF